MTPKDVKAYFNEINNRQESAEEIRYDKVVFKDDTCPEESKCHENVAHWIRENPSDTALKGWLVWGQLCAHSIICNENGEKFDITPMDGDQRPKFIVHVGSDATFEKVRENHPTYLLDSRPLPRL